MIFSPVIFGILRHWTLQTALGIAYMVGGTFIIGFTHEYIMEYTRQISSDGSSLLQENVPDIVPIVYVDSHLTSYCCD